MAEAPLPLLVVTRKTGDESLHLNGQAFPFNLLGFWQWSASDLVSNVTRGRLAEFIVATALGIDVTRPRIEWDAFDLTTPSGLKVEVKSAAYIQSWHQARPSSIVWRTPRTLAWDAATNRQSTESCRQADVYVLALLDHHDKPTIDPLNTAQWCFFVLPTRDLDARTRSQHSITLPSLKTLADPPVSYSELSAAVDRAGQAQRGSDLHELGSDLGLQPEPGGEAPARGRPLGRPRGHARGGAGPRLAERRTRPAEGKLVEESRLRPDLGRSST